uniref:Uncharacterized protein n=1 Tax=Ananas comosus var. bracteatus TaxID=296719 RepID=A0A6V7PNY0_ANACO|nr:unnamed protein product [Ananas comosus var. bracteatus]
MHVTAQDIISPPSVEIVDTTQHIANLTEPIDLCIGLQIKRDRRYRMEPINDSQAKWMSKPTDVEESADKLWLGFHPSFILVMGRSPRFVSISSDNHPMKTRFRYGSGGFP